MLDLRTTLCLACSSSLPPNIDNSELFMTKCCRRPICPRCLETNPRLARYNPCLACLAGVGVVRASSSARNKPGGNHVGGSGVQPMRVENLDGGVRDRDLFVLADEDDDGDGDDASTDEEEGRQARRSAAPPPPDVAPSVSSLPETPPPPPVTGHPEEPPTTDDTLTPREDQEPTQPDAPSSVYRLRRGDTLVGIALRFRLDAMELCRLNDLPTTTLSTTPHILHTRNTILLPPAFKLPPEDPVLGEARRVERAEKRLQTVTKETDWRVAKAYVAIVQDSDPSEVLGKKEKPGDCEGGLRKTPEGPLQGILESEAIDRYLDDAEWEEREVREGRGLAIQKFPWGSFDQKTGPNPVARQGSGGFKWPWSA